MKYKIIVDKQSRTNPSGEKKQYEIDIEELRCKDDIYDSLVITKDETYVMRRLSLSELHVLSVLEQEVKEPLGDLNIKLFEGDNYIYLIDMVGNKFYAEYLIKNDFNDIYVTTNEMNSAINQSAQQIELTVNQKLTGYSTTQEMNASINMKANEIKEEVSNKYATQESLTEERSQRIQTATQISEEVSKKVNNSDFTSAKIILLINNDESEAKINADKIVLSANDILNLLAGNTINLTSKNIVISSDKFSVDKNGKVTCSDINITGGKIVLISNSSNPTFIVKGTDNSEGYFSSRTISLAESSTLGIPAQLDISIYENGIPTLALIGRNLESSTTINSEGIETPKILINNEGYAMYGMNSHQYRCKWTGGQLQFWVDGTNVGTLSDKRLKTEIKEIDNDFIQAIKEIEMKQFKIANRNGLISFGILAQDLIEIFKKNNKNPFEYEIVQETQYKTDDETIYYTINYEQFLILKSKAQEQEIKELQEKDKQKDNLIQSLIERIEKLEAKK